MNQSLKAGLCDSRPGVVMGWDLTVEQRVLLHLVEHPILESKWDAPMTLTQAGISAAVGIQRKHLPRTLRRLIKGGCVDDQMRHVPNKRQRVHVYTLTSNGRQRAGDLLSKVCDRSVIHEGDSMLVEELRRHDLPILDVLRAIDEKGVFHIDRTVPAPSESVGDLGAEPREVLRSILEAALSDGIITVDERVIIDSLSRALSIESESATEIERQVRESLGPEGSSARIFQCMLGAALADGHIDESERAMLDSLAVNLDLTARQMDALRDEWASSQLPAGERAYLGALCAIGENPESSVIDALAGALSIDEETDERLRALAGDFVH